MVEKKEFVILFIKKNINEFETEFIPHKVIEGMYDKENNWFYDTKDGIQYLHIDVTPSTTVGYGCRTTLEIVKDSLSEESIEKIKKEMLDYANQFVYKRDLSRNEFIVTTNKKTGEERLFEDADNMPEFIPSKNSGSFNTGFDDILEISEGGIISVK